MEFPSHGGGQQYWTGASSGLAGGGGATSSDAYFRLEEENASMRRRILELEEEVRRIESRLAAAATADGARARKRRRPAAAAPPALPTRRTSDGGAAAPSLCEACGGPVGRRHSSSSEDDDDEEEESSSGKVSRHYASNPNPQSLPNGLVDGRSNSSAAFAQRVELLKKYKDEHGTADASKKVDRSLHFWVEKQRVLFRKLKRGQVEDDKRELVEERMKVLEELGVTLEKDSGPGWDEMFDGLRRFKTKWGHCCMTALPAEDDVDVKLKNWLVRERLKLRKGKQPPERREKLEGLGCFWLNWTDGKDDDDANGDGPGHGDSDEDGGGNDAAAASSGKDVRDGAGVSAADNDGSKATHNWYASAEKFRRQMAEKGNPFHEPNRAMGHWMRRQRRLHDQIRSGKRRKTDLDKFQIRFLTDLGFVVDSDEIKKEDERRRKEKVEKEFREKEEEPKRRLEGMRKEAEAADARVEELRREEKEAMKRARTARLEMQKAKRAGVEARRALAFEEQKNPAGKMVEVAPRGGNRKSGKAKIVGLRKTMCAGTELTFYELEFLDDGTIEKGVDGLFVKRLVQAPHTSVVGPAQGSGNMPQSTPPVTRRSTGQSKRGRRTKA